MPRVQTVKKARKDYPEYGIKKGETYYWWKFNFGPTMKSKTYPKPSQLTQSPFLQQLYDIQDRVNGLEDPDDLESIISDIESLKEECEENLSNMPEQLQENSDAGQTLQERIDALDEWISELQNIETPTDEELREEAVEHLQGEKYNSELDRADAIEELMNGRKEEILNEIRSCECGL